VFTADHYCYGSESKGLRHTHQANQIQNSYRELGEWALVHFARYSLNESKLEQRVIAINEAEAISKQKVN
jgi:E3 ubiquitin-protein ligase BRE1